MCFLTFCISVVQGSSSDSVTVSGKWLTVQAVVWLWLTRQQWSSPICQVFFPQCGKLVLVDQTKQHQSAIIVNIITFEGSIESCSHEKWSGQQIRVAQYSWTHKRDQRLLFHCWGELIRISVKFHLNINFISQVSPKNPQLKPKMTQLLSIK